MGPFPPLAKAVHHKPLKADREGITAAFNQFGPLIHSPRKPKPTQAGEGTKSTRMTTTGLRVDRKYIGWKGKLTCLLAFCIALLLWDEGKLTDITTQMSKPFWPSSRARSTPTSR